MLDGSVSPGRGDSFIINLLEKHKLPVLVALNKWDLVDKTSSYALTGAVFSQDRYAVDDAFKALENSAGNFYINDKPTGAVVGKQPFGGSRASGTNDKAGSIFNLLRWVSPRLIKEVFVPPKNYRYPFLDKS